MCDRCLSADEVVRKIAPDDQREPVSTALRRLRCYYQCVTQDLSIDSTDDEDEEDEFSLDDW